MTEKQYFEDTVKKVVNAVGFSENVNIVMFDHKKLSGQNKKAVGCCHRFSDGMYLITIDEYFVTECYEYFILNKPYSSWTLVGETLEQVICHEIAHLTEWRHGKRHTALMNSLLAMVG